jgi:hypothetical protein
MEIKDMTIVLGLKISDWIMILAVLLGPIIAVQLTRYLDNKKELTQRKLDLFRTPMSTRAYNISWDHVSALNRIDVEFNNKVAKEKEVLNSWKSYLDLLNDKNLTPENWNSKRIDLFVDLLHKMALVLNYDFDKTHIKNSAYSPIAHGNSEQEINEIRAGLIKILKGELAIPIQVQGGNGNEH